MALHTARPQLVCYQLRTISSCCQYFFCHTYQDLLLNQAHVNVIEQMLVVHFSFDFFSSLKVVFSCKFNPIQKLSQSEMTQSGVHYRCIADSCDQFQNSAVRILNIIRSEVSLREQSNHTSVICSTTLIVHSFVLRITQ